MTNNIATRRLTPCIILLLLMLAACHNPSPWGRQGEIADSLIEQHPDSVLLLLQGIDYSTLDEEGQAHYGLLLTAARYKLYQPVDTTFINRSIAYYSASHKGIQSSPFLGDKRGWGSNSSPLGGDKRGASLYYKAVVIYDLGKKQEATLLLKQAEQHAERSDDELLRNKIYENLEMVNRKSGNYLSALRYAKLFLESSRRLDDKLCLIRAYDKMAYCYNRLGKTDSVSYLLDKVLPNMVKGQDETTEAAFTYSNMANCCLSFHRYDQAWGYLQKAMSIHEEANQYVMLGIIHLDRGDTAKAMQAWQDALKFSDPQFSVRSYRLQAQIHEQRGMTKSALICLQKADSIEKQVRNGEMKFEIAKTQHDFDMKNTTGRWLYVCVAAFVVLFLVMTLYLLHVLSVRRKARSELRHLNLFYTRDHERNRRSQDVLLDTINANQRIIAREKKEAERLQQYISTYHSELATTAQQLEKMGCEEERLKEESLLSKKQYEKKILWLEKEIRKKEKALSGCRNTIERQQNEMQARLNEIEELRHELDELKARMVDDMGKGKEIYEKVLSDMSLRSLTTEEWEAFIEYYTVSNYQDYMAVVSQYDSLPMALEIYLILSLMGKSEVQMKAILGVGNSTIRSQKSRLKKRRRPESS